MHATSELDAWHGLIDLEPLLRTWLLRRCRDANELDDTVQETMLRAARYRARGHTPRRLEAWVLRIAANVVHDIARRDGRIRCGYDEEVALDDIASPDSVHECVGDAGAERWQLGTYVVTKDTALSLLDRALAALRGDDRALLRTYYSEARGCEEAAHLCGVPVYRAKMRLFRARRRLSRDLSRRLALADEFERPARRAMVGV